MKEALKALAPSQGMLGAFRRQFVATNMLFAIIVLAVVISAVAVITYRMHCEDVYQALDSRIELAKTRSGLIGGPGRMMQTDMEFGRTEGPHFENTENSPRESGSDQFVATSLYLLDNAWIPLVAYDEAFPIDAVVLNDAILHAKEDVEADAAAELKGTIGDQNLFYQVEPYQDGYLAAFASGYYVDRNMQNMLVPLAVSELVALVAFLVVSIMLARWAVHPVETAWNQQQQFIADANHELKTPLTVIRANDSILLSQPEATIKEQQQWIESTETEAQIMQDLVNDMLYLAKADNANASLEYSTVNFSEIVDSLLLQFESVAFEKGIHLKGDVPEDVLVEGDAARLQQMAGTLLDNACKYTDDEGAVSVKLRKAGATCTLTVNNTGATIDAEDLPHLFDRFYRSDKARTRTGGYGLGLAIAKSIVDDHKGTVSVTSTESDGTTFSVSLPAL